MVFIFTVPLILLYVLDISGPLFPFILLWTVTFRDFLESLSSNPAKEDPYSSFLMIAGLLLHLSKNILYALLILLPGQDPVYEFFFSHLVSLLRWTELVLRTRFTRCFANRTFLIDNLLRKDVNCNGH